MYHVIANLEKHFRSADKALEYYDLQFPIIPKIPSTRMSREDGITPRICVAPTIEDCFTAMGMHRFLRCVESFLHFDTPEEKEVYPFLLLSFSQFEGYYTPSEKEVPDVGVTNEHWLRKPACPETVDLLWLTSNSIAWDQDINADDFGQGSEICAVVDYLKEPPAWGIHPWLDGRGHTLDGVSAEKYFERKQCYG